MSLRFLGHASSELRRGQRLQASEKVWGGVAQQLKAIAEQRGWRHDGHASFSDIASYLAKEYGQPDLVGRVASLDHGQHRNYYKNNLLPRDIESALEEAKTLVADLEKLRQSPPRPYTIADKHDSDLVRRLSGDRHPKGETSSDAFTSPDRLAERKALWGQRPEDSTGAGAPPQHGGPTPPTLSGASAAVQVPASTSAAVTVQQSRAQTPAESVTRGSSKPKAEKPPQPSQRPTSRQRRLPSGHRER